jgi:hypothetical protein
MKNECSQKMFIDRIQLVTLSILDKFRSQLREKEVLQLAKDRCLELERVLAKDHLLHLNDRWLDPNGNSLHYQLDQAAIERIQHKLDEDLLRGSGFTAPWVRHQLLTNPPIRDEEKISFREYSDKKRKRSEFEEDYSRPRGEAMSTTTKEESSYQKKPSFALSSAAATAAFATKKPERMMDVARFRNHEAETFYIDQEAEHTDAVSSSGYSTPREKESTPRPFYNCFKPPEQLSSTWRVSIERLVH